VQLEVRDTGAGFDVEAVRYGSGLGIVSMQERVHVMNGEFQMESKPGAGTRILAWVPIVKKEEDSQNELARRASGMRSGR
jgi:signal transduction histidine kinase